MKIKRQNKLNPVLSFKKETSDRIKSQGKNIKLKKAAKEFLAESVKTNYSYNFTWMGRPIIQYPQDMIAMQEIIWEIKPDLIIETGIAHGGSLIFYASLLEIIGKGIILGIDIDIRAHNKIEIKKHPAFKKFKRIKMIEGSSVSGEVLKQVKQIAQNKKTVIVALDSNHTHEHVLSELNLYSPFVSKGSYLVVFDTLIEEMPENFYPDRSWGRGNNARTAVNEFLKKNKNFRTDNSVDDKLLITVSPGGYLKRIK